MAASRTLRSRDDKTTDCNATGRQQYLLPMSCRAAPLATTQDSAGEEWPEKMAKKLCRIDSCRHVSEGRGRGPLMICAATYVIGFRGHNIWKTRETDTGSSVRRAGARITVAVPWLDATSRRRRRVAPITVAAIFVTPAFLLAAGPHRSRTIWRHSTQFRRKVDRRRV